MGFHQRHFLDALQHYTDASCSCTLSKRVKITGCRLTDQNLLPCNNAPYGEHGSSVKHVLFIFSFSSNQSLNSATLLYIFPVLKWPLKEKVSGFLQRLSDAAWLILKSCTKPEQYHKCIFVAVLKITTEMGCATQHADFSQLELGKRCGRWR